MPMRRFSLILLLFFAAAPFDAAFAQLAGTGDFHIDWEVKNRFRLFRNEADFVRLVAADHGDGVLAAENRLENDTDGLGWAKDVVGNLCLDDYGALVATCQRDGVNESYLVPTDHPVGVRLSGPVQPDTTCVWSFDDGQNPVKQNTVPCNQEIRLRVPSGHTTVATVDIPLGDGTAQRVVTEIAVRDVLIAGLGDSIAAGEGNPDRAVQLDGGFCFKRFLRSGGSQYYRPSRAGYDDDRSCENGPSTPAAAKDWASNGARWMSPACHRSLYSYQVRTTLALAIEQPHIAVTFIPLACTGATIGDGMFEGQLSDDCPWVVGIDSCSGTSPAQFGELKDIIAALHRQAPNRNLDMMLLTVGANDVNFAGLVANVIVDSTTERILLKEGGAIAAVADSQKVLDNDLPDAFAQLRTALKPYVSGNLGRVVFVSYANPAMQAEGKPCTGSRDGLDVHPAFGADSERLRATANFVDTKFLPKIKALATCDGNKICRDPSTERMTFVDGHQAAFDRHGMCVRSTSDPEFDRNCFSTSGDSFQTDPTTAPDNPMACGEPPSNYRPYAPRGRWIRTANDSYFTAMTYPEGMPAVLKPSDIHDALWGIGSAVYGGAVHPTAEGYAAMADAALPAVRGLLGLTAPPAVQSEPLPPPADPATPATAAAPAAGALSPAPAPAAGAAPPRSP
jgi:lysophospholipase L1-like esterase